MASKICTRQYLVVCNALYYDLAYVAARLVNGAVVSCYCSVASNTYYSFTNFSDLESPTALVVTLGLLVYINRLVLMALYYFGVLSSFSTALHALTVGAIGGMIIAMIARVSLGHSGRPLQPKKVMSVSFILVLVAALVRSVAIFLLPSLTLQFYWVSAILWAIAFVIFVLAYFNILTTLRPDGRPG